MFLRKKLPLATAMVFCHRFYTQNSHANPENDYRVRFLRIHNSIDFHKPAPRIGRTLSLETLSATWLVQAVRMYPPRTLCVRPSQVVAAASLFLSTKVEECVIALEDVVRVIYKAKNKNLSSAQADQELLNPVLDTPSDAPPKSLQNPDPALRSTLARSPAHACGSKISAHRRWCGRRPAPRRL